VIEAPVKARAPDPAWVAQVLFWRLYITVSSTSPPAVQDEEPFNPLPLHPYLVGAAAVTVPIGQLRQQAVLAICP